MCTPTAPSTAAAATLSAATLSAVVEGDDLIEGRVHRCAVLPVDRIGEVHLVGGVVRGGEEEANALEKGRGRGNMQRRLARHITLHGAPPRSKYSTDDAPRRRLAPIKRAGDVHLGGVDCTGKVEEALAVERKGAAHQRSCLRLGVGEDGKEVGGIAPLNRT